jgi:hypothetical protein
MGYYQTNKSLIPRRVIKKQKASANSEKSKYGKAYYAIYLGNGNWKRVGQPKGKRRRRGGYRTIDDPNKVIY